jgi:hypothetical protein
MIKRRTVLIGTCGLIAAPALVRAASIMPVRSIGGLITAAVRESTAGAVAFRIHGWDAGHWSETEKSGQRIVSFQLTNSWRAAWL